ncbi:MAG: NHL domain-containing protein [Planctomycetota bacterium]|jgi:sugar lactone lactonase YvrE
MNVRATNGLAAASVAAIALLVATNAGLADTITTFAGLGPPGGYSGDGGPAVSADVRQPYDATVDVNGNVYIADELNHRIRRVDAATGIIETIAGTGAPGSSGDGGLATAAKVRLPKGIIADAAGNVFVADTGNNKIRKIDVSTGIIDTYAGTGQAGSSGDGGAATSARLKAPQGMILDAAGNLFIADTGNHKVRKVDAATGIITTVAGTGSPGSSGDGGAATAANLKSPEGVAVDGSDHLFIADTGNNKIRRVDAATGFIATFAGTGSAGSSGDGGAATSATFNTPSDVAVDGFGDFYVADSNNNKVRKIDGVTTIVSTLAGTGSPGDSGDGGPPADAEFRKPDSVSVLTDLDDETVDLYITDTLNSKIRTVRIGGTVTIVQWQEVDPRN